MITAWFLLMFPASHVQGIFMPVNAMDRPFKTEKECLAEAQKNPDISFTNAGKPDPSIRAGVVCVKGIIR